MNQNQTKPDLYLNTDNPRIINKIYKDNIRNIQPRNNYSDPRTNIGNKNYNIPNQIPMMVAQPQYPQPIYQQMAVNPTPAGAPVGAPIMVPYNMQYGQPVVIQEIQPNNVPRTVNNAPKTIIIKEEQVRIPRRHNKEEDCFTGCLAGCASCLAICCLMSLCCPGPHGHPHHHRRW